MFEHVIPHDLCFTILFQQVFTPVAFLSQAFCVLMRCRHGLGLSFKIKIVSIQIFSVNLFLVFVLTEYFVVWAVLKSLNSLYYMFFFKICHAVLGAVVCFVSCWAAMKAKIFVSRRAYFFIESMA
jgi:hypothetical protein